MTQISDLSPSLSAYTIAAATALLISACGGGGGGSDAVSTASAAPVAEAAAASSPAAPAASAPVASALPEVAASPDQLLAQAMEMSAPTTTTATTTTTTTPTEPATASAAEVATTPGSDNTDATALGVTKSAATDAAPTGALAAGRIFYVDSKLGSDAYTGLAASAGSAASGPWRSLARLKLAALAAGDTVRLACGSEWNETLALASSGSATQAITVAAYPAGCATKPVINGAISLAASQWSLHKGSIYKASLAAAPLQVYASSGSATFTQAHHPNQGFDSSQPASLYLRMAADADSVLVNGRATSSYLTTGADLKLPTGASITAGTQVRIRSIAWAVEEQVVASVSGSRLNLANRSAYPLLSGWGYYLLGQLWMLDAPGEWHYDSAGKTLYAWMPDSKAPSAPVLASQLPVGIDLIGRQYITIDGLNVRRVGTGATLQGSLGVVVKNSRIEDTTEHGINAGNSQKTTVDASSFVRIGMDAITGQDDILPAASGLQATNNTLSEIGLVMNGELPTSLPRRARAAIRPGANATVSGNSISNSAYIGIWTLANAIISNNLLYGTCTQLDDCGAIYVSGANNNSVISGNLVQRSRGALAGKSPAAAYTQAQGIYLDDFASGVKVQGNSVTDADSGIQLHIAANNTISGNKLYGNRVNQLWLQETHNTTNRLGDLYGNTVTANQIASTSAAARGIYLDTVILNTTRFASFDQNRYLDAAYPLVAEERTPFQVNRFTLTDWLGATADGVPRGLDVNGSGTSQTRYASILTNGNSIVPNGQLSKGSTGWTSWNADKPLGTLVREACTPGWCARYVAGASAGLVSSPNFSVGSGSWYRISFDAATGADAQALSVVVRRGGGGSNSYETLSDRSLNVTASRSWKRYSAIFKSTKTVNAADPLTQDLGARVDFQNIVPGQSVSIANLELVPIVPAEALTRSDLLVNASASPAQAACPVVSTQPALCSAYLRLADNQPVAWPYYLWPRGTEIVYTRDARLLDSDGDGIPDGQDACPNTDAGLAVNSRGCALAQF